MAKDPVCGMQVDEDKAAATDDFEGKTYRFCSTACKERFQESPHRYIDKVKKPEADDELPIGGKKS
jgi:YHS domain-containing protein